MTIGTSNVFAETLYDSDIRLVSRTENDDGTIIVVINENGKDLKMTFTPVEVNSISPYSSSDMPGGYRLPSDYYNWNSILLPLQKWSPHSKKRVWMNTLR